MTPLELVGSLGIVGYGLGAIGPGIGVGLIFASVIQGTARQPEARGAMMGTAWIGFAVTEALAHHRHRPGLRLRRVVMGLLLPLSAAHNPLLPAPIEIILAVVFVLLLTVVIAKFVVPRFEATYAERTAAIQGGIEKAEKAQEAAEAALAEYNAQLAEARTEAAKIREDAKTQGTQILVELREQAQSEAARIKSQGEAQLDAERAQVLAQLRSEIGGLATTLASRIVGESLEDDERARRTVDRFLADLEGQSTGITREDPMSAEPPEHAGWGRARPEHCSTMRVPDAASPI